MRRLDQPSVTFWVLLAGLYCVAWLVQARLFLNWDVSYLLQAAARLLAGGNYARDFFTPNPPLILYLYLPPLVLSQYLHLNLVLLVRGYVFILASGSFSAAYLLTPALMKGVEPAATFLRQIFLLVLALVLLLLPFYDFGQREHLLLILTLPYFLLVACRLQGVAVSAWLACFTGLGAGIGFALKPQFYLLPLLIELAYLFRQKKFLAVLRVETLAIAGVLVLYGLVLFYLYPDFTGVVLPYVLRNYYGSVGEPWSGLLFNNLALFCCLPLAMYLLFYKKNPQKILSTVLALALVGFLLSYLAQRTAFYYHLLPAFSVALLLLALLFSAFVLEKERTGWDYLGVALVAALGAAFLFYQARLVWLLLIFATPAYFCFFGLLFAFLLAAAPQKLGRGRIVASVFFILLTGFVCFYLAQRTNWSSHQVLITTGVLLALFGLLASRTGGGLGANIFLAVLGLILFAHPVFFSYDRYWLGLTYREKVLDKLIGFMQGQAPGRSLYVFSNQGNYGSPLTVYTNSRLVQRLDCLWPAVGFVRHPAAGGQGLQDKNFFLEMVAEDLRIQKPDLVFVDKQDRKMLAWDKHFDYLVFLSENRHFKAEWKAYRYLTTLKEAPQYELAVYKRVD